MRGLKVAVSFLTRVPVDAQWNSGADLGRAVVWFPVVGAAVGASVGLVAAGLGEMVPTDFAALVAVGLGLIATGAFHEDGLADTFDGLAGGYSPEQRIEIMRDSRLGTFGAAALFVMLASKVALLAALAAEPWWRIVGVMAAAGAMSRASAVWWMLKSPPATGGLGADYLAAVSRTGVFGAVLVGMGAAVVPGPGGSAALVAGFLVGVGPVWWARRTIGGITGDVLGAVQVVSEIAYLATIVGLAWWW